MNNHKRFKRNTLIFFFVSILVIFLFLLDPQVGIFIENAGREGGVLSSLIVGAFYTTSVTSPIATGAIYYLGKVQHPLQIAFIGAFGSVFVDYLFFRYFKQRATPSLKYLSNKLKLKNHTKKIFKFLAPLAAVAVIASPLPDELGLAILATINFKTKWTLLISYFANFIGILLISWLGSVL